MSDKVYIGWIPGSPNDLQKWRALGVTGEMKYTQRETAFGFGYFAYCIVEKKETLDELVKNGLPNPESFSLIPAFVTRSRKN